MTEYIIKNIQKFTLIMNYASEKKRKVKKPITITTSGIVLKRNTR
jgi:hypothetical protein